MNICRTTKIIDELRQSWMNKNRKFSMRVYTDYKVYEVIEHATVEMFEQNRKDKIDCQLLFKTADGKENVVAEYFGGRTYLNWLDGWNIGGGEL